MVRNRKRAEQNEVPGGQTRADADLKSDHKKDQDGEQGEQSRDPEKGRATRAQKNRAGLTRSKEKH